MTEVEVFVWHDSDGNITATGTPHPDMVERILPIAGKDRSVLPIKVDSSDIDKLHETHRVDVKRRVLVPSPPANAK
jgi:hypothetical protein